MPFDAGRPAGPPSPWEGQDGPKQKIAVIGSGVSGLSAAWLLSFAHDVTIYERDMRLGGHANTVDTPVTGHDGAAKTLGVDAGFIVFNKPNYPNLTALLDYLEVPIEDTCMSFAASMRSGLVEYSGQTLSSVFARRSSVLSPTHWAMLRDIVRFHGHARAALREGLDDGVALRDFVASKGYSKAFARDFLEPMAAAIWSTPSMKVLDYPAAAFFRFFANHGLLQVLNLPIWNTITGGSRRYVNKITRSLRKKARLGVEVRAVRRDAAGVEVIDSDGVAARFDQVVIATHGDMALRLLDQPSARERDLLGAFGYQPNRAVVHFDAGQMPRRQRAWASWNYVGDENGAAVTYWMNRLQNLDCREDVFVTLNPQTDIDRSMVVAEFDYDHPVFDIAAGRAQKRIWELQGEGGVWFCGAHFGQGFHEDGLQAGLAVAEALGGVRRPWDVENESGRIFLPDQQVMAAE